MPTSTFTKLAQNLPMNMQGWLVGAKAIDLGRQDAIAEKLLADYVAKTKEYAGEPKTTDQQIGAVTTDAGKDNLFKSIEQQAVDYQTQVNSILAKRERHAELYRSTVQQLSKLDSPEAQKIAETLGVTFGDTEKQLSLKLDALQSQQRYRANAFNTEVAKLDFKVKDLVLKSALQDDAAKDLALQFLPNLNGKIALAYDTTTGELKDTNFIDNFFKEFSANTKGKDKNLVGRAYMILDEYASRKVRGFRESAVSSLTSIKSKLKKVSEDNKEFFESFNKLRDLSAYADRYLSKEDGQFARQEYLDKAIEMHDNGELTPKQFDAILMKAKDGQLDYFSDPRVIQNMDDPSMQKVAQEMYDMFVNKDSETSYWDVLDVFAKRLNLNSYLDLNHKKTYYLPTMNPETFESKNIPVNLYSGDGKGDSNGIMTYGFNPYNPMVTQDYEAVVGEAYQKASKAPGTAIDNGKPPPEQAEWMKRLVNQAKVTSKKKEVIKVKGVKKSFGGSVPPENYGELTKGDKQLIDKGMESDYKPIIENTAKKVGLDDTLLFSMVAQESAFRNDVGSDKGARGLMQITPIAYREAKRLKFIPQKTTWEDVKTDPNLNLHIGAKYIKWLIDHYGGDLEKALAAYNWGMGNVNKKGLTKAPKETKDYIDNILRRHYNLRRKKEIKTKNKGIELKNVITEQDKTKVK